MGMSIWIESLLLIIFQINALIIEDPSRHNPFKFGAFLFSAPNHTEEFNYAVITSCIEDVEFSSGIFLIFKSFYGIGIQTAAEVSIASSDLLYASHKLNHCSINKNNLEKEILFHVSLACWPWNEYSAKNLGYAYEWQGKVGATNSLYRETVALTGDPGCAFHLVFICPPLFWDERHAMNTFISIVNRANRLLASSSKESGSGSVIHKHKPYDPMLAVRELQLNPQYIGIGPGVLSELYSLVLIHNFPELVTNNAHCHTRNFDCSRRDQQTSSSSSSFSLNTNYVVIPCLPDVFTSHLLPHCPIPFPDSSRVPLSSPRRKFRLGIVSEHTSN
eukprot:gene5141-10277_t